MVLYEIFSLFLLTFSRKKGITRCGDHDDEVEADPNIEKLWRAYQKKFSYAADLSWHTVMDSVETFNSAHPSSLFRILTQDI